MPMRKSEAKRISLTKIVAEWKELCAIKKDAHAAISADEGDGKTILGITLITKHLKGDLWNNIVYSSNPKEFFDKYESMKGGALFDEALDILNRLNWSHFDTKRLVKKFRGSVRKEKNMVFLYNVQLFRDLHSYWRTHRIRYWIELLPREWFNDVNFAYVMQRQRVPFITGKRDVWLLDAIETEWMNKMKGGALIGQKYINMLRTHPFYKGEFKFGDIEPKIYKKYLKLRIEAKVTYEKDSNADDVPKRILHEKYLKGRLIKNLNETKRMPKKDIAKLMGVSKAAITKYIHAYEEMKDVKIVFK